jgi:hypothetical protein
LNFFPPNRGVDFYFEFLPAKMTSLEITTEFVDCSVRPSRKR